MALTPTEISAWIQVAQVLASAGIATVNEVESAIRSIRGNVLSDTDLDALCDAVIADATVREAKAHQDAQDDGA